MKYKIEESKIIIFIDDDEREVLSVAQEEDENFTSDNFMLEFFEELIANSELDWTDSSETRDLTQAPMLCIRDEYGDVDNRWAFMDYQVISVQERLLNEGKVAFVGGNPPEWSLRK